MPRIGGPGPGPIVPPQTQGAQGAQQTTAQPKTDFASKVAQAAQQQGTDSARLQATRAQAQSELTGKAKDLAKKFADGKLSQREATREFVSLILEERFPQFKKRKKKKGQDGKDDEDEDDDTAEARLEEAITELIDRDPSMAKKLSSQFKKLAKG
jgi:hypothetical protein